MKKSIRSIIVVLVMVTLCVTIPCFASNATANSPFVATEGLTIENFKTIQEIETANKELSMRQEIAHQMAECARALGYPEDCQVIQIAQTEWQSAQNEKKLNTEKLNTWNHKYEEYPYATYVWLYLTDTCEYNNNVAAGIMGNMMAEVGGGTLDLQYWLYGSRGYYYGICQWNKGAYPEIHGTDLIAQCDYLLETIKYEIDTFGYAYSRGYKYADFIALTNTRDAALMFAKTYERCGSGTYFLRQNWAEDAYNYFVS